MTDAEQPQDKDTTTSEPTPTTAAPTPASAAAPAAAPVPVDDSTVVAAQEAEQQKQAEEQALPAEEIRVPDLRAGMTVRVHQKIKEGDKHRIQIFQGMVTALRGKTPVTKTMTVQKQSFGVLVEKIFPLASPLIEKIEVVKIAKVRRSKLYFLPTYAKRLKETLVK